jgi:hypothetical protein
MVIPCQLVLLLERLFGYKVDGKVQSPSFEERMEIFSEALTYVDKYPHLNEYVCNHWNIVAEKDIPTYQIAAE